MKNFLILTLFLFPNLCFSASKNDTCTSKTILADMKGNGSSERIEVVNETLDDKTDECHFKSLMIFENNKKVYEEVVSDKDEPMSPARDINVERFHNGTKEMLFYTYHRCSNCNGIVVIGFLKGNYQSVRFDGASGGDVIDLESDGNKQIVLDPGGYYGTAPRIYDYDPEKDVFDESSSRHPKFFKELIAECEANLIKYPEKGTDCCNRTANLQVIASAAKTLGDNELFEKTNERLSGVLADIGKAYFLKKDYHQAISNYNGAVKSNPRNYVAFNLLGYSYLRYHKITEAISSLKNSVALNPAYLGGHYNLALAYWANGEKDDALNEIREVLRIDPGYKKTIRNDTQFKEFEKLPEFRELISN